MLVFLTIVGAVLLGLVVVVIYLNDRVNELERRTAAAGGGAGGGGGDGNSPSPTWQGLTGKKLWDVMCGKKGITDLPPATVESMRPAYESVLIQHIQALFQAGQSDARKGASVQPTATRMLPSPLGNVQSWIPLNHANALYRAGFNSAKEDIFEAERARMSLDETAAVLFAQTNLNLAQPFSEMMMGGGEDGADPSAPAGTLGAAGAGGPVASATALTGGASPAGALPGATASGLGLPGSNATAGNAPAAAAAVKGMFAASAPSSSRTDPG